MLKMSKFYVLIVLLLVQKANSQAKLNVELLYESLCPDSLNFITQQLHPVFKDLAPFVNLKLTPFGKSAHVGNGQFICQHGPRECKGNRIQSCVLKEIPDQLAQVEYVNCFMKTFRKNGQGFGESCAARVGVNPDQITSCYSSDLGLNLQLLAEKKTLSVAPKFVPTVLYNDIFDQQLQDASLVDFGRVVCTLLGQTRPDACHESSIVKL